MYQARYVAYIIPASKEEDDGSCERPKVNNVEVQWRASRDIYINSAIGRLMGVKRGRVSGNRLRGCGVDFDARVLGIAHEHSSKKVR
jgi:hypothetical protein